METYSERSDNRFLRFGDIILDLYMCTVFREARTFHPPEEYWNALRLLVEKRPNIVNKEELFEVLGSDNDATLTKQIERIRDFLGDTAIPRRFIKSERKTGYRWIAVLESTDRAHVAEPRAKVQDGIPFDVLNAEYLVKLIQTASEPKVQKTLWGPLFSKAAGIYIDSLDGKNVPWTELKAESEERVLPLLV